MKENPMELIDKASIRYYLEQIIKWREVELENGSYGNEKYSNYLRGIIAMSKTMIKDIDSGHFDIIEVKCGACGGDGVEYTGIEYYGMQETRTCPYCLGTGIEGLKVKGDETD